MILNIYKKMSINQQVAYHVLLQTFNIITTKKPAYLYNKMQLKSDDGINICPQTQLYTIKILKNTTLGRNSFCYKSAKLFNCLPLKLRKAVSKSEFKTGIKKWIFGNIPIKPP